MFGITSNVWYLQCFGPDVVVCLISDFKCLGTRTHAKSEGPDTVLL